MSRGEKQGRWAESKGRQGMLVLSHLGRSPNRAINEERCWSQHLGMGGQSHLAERPKHTGLKWKHLEETFSSEPGEGAARTCWGHVESLRLHRSWEAIRGLETAACPKHAASCLRSHLVADYRLYQTGREGQRKTRSRNETKATQT